MNLFDINFTLREKNKIVGFISKNENDATHQEIYAEYRCKPLFFNQVVNSFQASKQERLIQSQNLKDVIEIEAKKKIEAELLLEQEKQNAYLNWSRRGWQNKKR